MVYRHTKPLLKIALETREKIYCSSNSMPTSMESWMLWGGNSLHKEEGVQVVYSDGTGRDLPELLRFPGNEN